MNQLYNLSQSKIKYYFSRALSAGHPEKYVKLSKIDCSLRPTAFTIYSSVITQAPFKTQLINFQRQKQYLRTRYHKSTITRTIRRLKADRLFGFSKHLLQQRHDSKNRPVSWALVAGTHNKETAIYNRFLVWLAFQAPGKRLTVTKVQKGMKIRRYTAAGLLRAARALKFGIKYLRWIVFYSVTPQSWKYQSKRNFKKEFTDQLRKIETERAADRKTTRLFYRFRIAPAQDSLVLNNLNNIKSITSTGGQKHRRINPHPQQAGKVAFPPQKSRKDRQVTGYPAISINQIHEKQTRGEGSQSTLTGVTTPEIKTFLDYESFIPWWCKDAPEAIKNIFRLEARKQNRLNG